MNYRPSPDASVTSSSSSDCLQDAADNWLNEDVALSGRRRRPVLLHSAASWCRHLPDANHHNLREWGKTVPISAESRMSPHADCQNIHSSVRSGLDGLHAGLQLAR